MNSLAAFFLTSIVSLAPAQPTVQNARSLTVTVSGPTQSASIPQGAQRVPMLIVQLSASCAAPVTISSLTLHHSGLGGASDLSRLYAMDGMNRLTRSAVLHGTPPSADIRFLPRLLIPACGTKTIAIDADFSPNAAAGSEHRLSIVSKADIVSSAETVTVSTKSSPVLKTTPSTPASLTVSFLPVTANSVLFGADRIIARFLVTSTSSHDQLIRSITLTNDGSASDTDLQNLYLTTSGNRILTDTLTTLSGDTAHLIFDPPLRLTGNESMLLQLHADVRASKRRTIKIILEEPSDVEAIDATLSSPST